MAGDRKGWVLVPPPREDEDVGFTSPLARRRAQTSHRLLGVLAVVTVLAGWWLWRSARSDPSPQARTPPVQLQPIGEGNSGLAPSDSSVAPREPLAASASSSPPPSSIQPPAAAAESGLPVEQADTTAALDATQIEDWFAGASQRRADSLAAVSRRHADSVAEEERRLAELRRADSLVLLEATNRAAQLAREQQELEAPALPAADVRESRLARARSALAEWLTLLVTAVDSARYTDPVLAVGPPDFMVFASKHHISLREAILLDVTVSEDDGTARAQWVARWVNPFGTGSSRRMKATAMAARDGETWRIRSWKITQGAP